MYLKRFYDENLAHASYLVGCQALGEAIVIDPSRDTSPYLAEAEAQGLEIVAVTETHIHADYLSGTRQLAQQTGAKMYLSAEGGQDWQYQFVGEKDTLVVDGDIIKLGNLSLEVMHTPGHTPEHICFILTDHPATEQPIGAFTGDFIFVGDVGRPDLLEKAARIEGTMKKGAADLYNSLQRFKKLPDHIQIWPAHGAGSACGKALGAIPSSVLGYEKITNWAFQITAEEDFVREILDGQPEPPKYFAEMKKLNKIGPDFLSEDSPARLDPSKIKEVQKDKKTLIDLRGSEAFSDNHPKDALFLPLGSSLVTWAGWLLSYQEDLYLLAENQETAKEAVRALRSIGLDKVVGFFLGEDLAKADVAMEKSRRIPASEVDEENQDILDVRSLKEWESGHLAGAQHIHLGYLQDHLKDVPTRPVIHCGSGVRSLIASTLLQKARKQPIDVLGGYTALKERKEIVST